MKNRCFFFTLVCSIYIYISVLVDLERHFAFHPAVFDTKKAHGLFLGFFFFFLELIWQGNHICLSHSNFVVIHLIFCRCILTFLYLFSYVPKILEIHRLTCLV